MKYHELIKELSVRALYILLLAGAITFLNYLNYGNQLEYFQGHSDFSQGSTFCYGTGRWQWLEQDSLRLHCAVNIHVSKAWLTLSLPCLLSFSTVDGSLRSEFYVFAHNLIFYAVFAIYQFYAFIKPALIKASFIKGRTRLFKTPEFWKAIFRAAFLWDFAYLWLILSTLLVNIVWLEFTIEPLDSELI